MLNIFKADITRYFRTDEQKAGISWSQMLLKVVRTECLWAILSFRIGHWIICDFHVPVLKPLLKILYAIMSRPLEILLNVTIDVRADIGKGLYLGHIGSVWIGPIKMGECCNISQEVTIGHGGRGEFRGLPTVGSRVYFAPGAKVYGNITIGNNVAIGANAVVSKSVPDNAVVVGNPGRVVGYEGSEGLIELQ